MLASMPLQRLHQCDDWLTVLIGQVSVASAPMTSQGRLSRLLDATAVPQAGAAAKRATRCGAFIAFDLPAERFGSFVLTDHTQRNRLDRIAVVPGEICIADRVYLHPEHIATVCEVGGDVIVRSQDENGNFSAWTSYVSAYARRRA